MTWRERREVTLPPLAKRSDAERGLRLIGVINLSSDTFTLPTKEMRLAMAHADVASAGADPTVTALERKVADLLGKEEALLVPSGTQGTLVAVLAQAARGQGVIVESRSYLYISQGAAIADLTGIHMTPVDGHRGVIHAQHLRGAIGSDVRMLCLESPHAHAGGIPIPVALARKVCAVARRSGLRTHLDGARLFHAAVALGVPLRELAAPFDTVMVNLNKGLGAPVGGVVAGGAAFAEEARRWRKTLGGSIRQAGVLAAAGIVALDSMMDRLREDHTNARILAQGLAELQGFHVELDTVQTNMVFAEIMESNWQAPVLKERLARDGVLCRFVSPRVLRFVTHKDVSREDIETALQRIQRVMRGAQY